MPSYVSAKFINIANTTYTNCQNITSVNLNRIEWTNSSMSNAFLNCTNLQTVSNIHNLVTNLDSAFANCTSLTTCPTLPTQATSMIGTFAGCKNITTMPTIPNSVTDISHAFAFCRKLTTTTTLPEILSNVDATFMYCTNLVTPPTIPSHVQSMDMTFSDCYNLTTAPTTYVSLRSMAGTYINCCNLTGSIQVPSPEITNATACFARTSKEKYVYIPFKYTNGVYTTTYNSFTAAGYDTEGTTDGVYLIDSGATTLTLTINPTPSTATTQFWQRYGTGTPYYAWVLDTTEYYTTSETPQITDTVYNKDGTDTGLVVLDYDATLGIAVAANEYATLTINPTPADATVTITAPSVYSQSGNTIRVLKGTELSYTVSKEHYVSQSGSITLTEDTTVDVTLSGQLYTYTINSTPEDATVILTASGYSQSNKSITVPYNTEVAWSVSKVGYTSQSGTVIITENTTNDVTLSIQHYTYTITPVPAEAQVTLTAEGYTQSGNSITVPYNTVVTWRVSAEHYITETGSITVIQNTSETKSLTLMTYTFTIDPTPADAEVNLIALGYQQEDKSITVPYNTEVSWLVEADGYESQANTYTVVEDYTLPVILNPEA